MINLHNNGNTIYTKEMVAFIVDFRLPNVFLILENKFFSDFTFFIVLMNMVLFWFLALIGLGQTSESMLSD